MARFARLIQKEHDHPMLQKLGDHITNCLARAEDAEHRGLEISDPEAKAETTRMAKACVPIDKRVCESLVTGIGKEIQAILSGN
jgi:hypothetical protein